MLAFERISDIAAVEFPPRGGVISSGMALSGNLEIECVRKTSREIGEPVCRLSSSVVGKDLYLLVTFGSAMGIASERSSGATSTCLWSAITSRAS